MRDNRWHDLTDVECHKLLAERHLGRLALTDPDGPVIFPVNYALHEGAMVFRTDPGSKLDIIAVGARVAFEVDAVDEGSRTGWSVVVRGQAAEVSEPADLDRLHGLPLYPWAPGAKARYIRVRPVSITGRRIAMPPICRSPGGADVPVPGGAATAMTATPVGHSGGLAATSWWPVSSLPAWPPAR